MMILVFSILFLFANSARAQADLPGKIRGYKVYNAKIIVRTAPAEKPAESGAELFVKIGEPELTDVSLAGVTIELPTEIKSSDQSGTIDFLIFYDFRVNDVAVEIEEYKNSFALKKNHLIKLLKPIKISIGAKQSCAEPSRN